MAIRNFSRVGVLGSVFALLSLLLGDFVIVRPNRLAAGEALSAFAAQSAWQWVVPVILLLALCGIALQPRRQLARLALLLGPLAVLTLLWGQASAALTLMQQGTAFTRVSVGFSAWLTLLGIFVVYSDMLPRARPGPLFKSLLLFGFLAGLIFLGAAGHLDSLSLVKEMIARRDRFVAEFGAHLFITGLAVGCAAAIGLPLGLVAFRFARIRTAVFSVLNIIQTVPSLALFGLLIAPLAFLAREIPLLKTLGVHGIGWAPAVIALTLYGLLPIVRNTYSGFAMVDGHVLEAGKGMGMGRSQLFIRVELPMAAPIILNGLRIASVQNIGNTAVAALIGAGGFGVFIFQGLGQSAIDLVLLGAVPTILLAVVVDYLFQAVITVITPRGAL